MNIYVGNLSSEVSEDDLRQAFEQFGQVESVIIVTDKFTRLSKGFGFIKMASQTEGQSAIDGLNEKEIKGKAIIVSEAHPKIEKPGGRKKIGGGRGGKGGGKGGQNIGRGSQGSGRGGQGSGRGGQGSGRGGQGSGRGGQSAGRGVQEHDK